MPESHDSAESPAPAGMLVPTQGAFAVPELGSYPRPLAGFVTQLLACERRLSAYRVRRRAEPSEATRRYGTGEAPDRAQARFERVL